MISWVRATAAVGAGALLAVGLMASAAGAQAGYTPVPGSPDTVLNPAHRGAVGSTFTQDCKGVPIPVPQGGVVWHFILPQRGLVLLNATPAAIFFDQLTAQFQKAGTVTIHTFGPPNQNHAWVATPTDDVLLDASADAAVLPGATASSTFNLSHTCASSSIATTTTGAPTPSRGSFPIVKAITGEAAGSQGEMRFDITCSAPNSSIPSWRIPGGVSGTVSTIVTGITTPATCNVTEAESGRTEQVDVIGQTRVGASTREDVVVCGSLQRARAGRLTGAAFVNEVEPVPPVTTTGPTTTTEAPSSSTSAAATTAPPTVAPTTAAPTTGAPTTAGPTTATPTTGPSTSEGPATTEESTTSTIGCEVSPETTSSVLPPTGATAAPTAALASALVALGAFLVVAVAFTRRRARA